MDAQDLQVDAAVGLPPAAGNAAPAVQIRLDRAALAGLQPSLIRADLDDLHSQFVPENARIAEERLPAAVRVQVGAANADPVHAHQGFAGRKRLGFGGCAEG